MKDFLSIKEFSKLSGIETSTLRYWDEIGLFSPAMRNPENNYRYYTPPQIVAVNFITVLGNLNVPLKMIDEIERNRTPEGLVDLSEQQESILQMRMRKLQESFSIICTRRQLIKAGLRADTSKIAIEELPERMFILGPPSGRIAEGDGFYQPFVKFRDRAQKLRINLDYPIGGYRESLEVFAAGPAESDRFFSLDPTGNVTWEAGEYLVGYTRGYYGEYGDLPQQMLDHAREQGLTCSGPAYILYLHDEICLKDPSQYLAQISVAVNR